MELAGKSGSSPSTLNTLLAIPIPFSSSLNGPTKIHHHLLTKQSNTCSFPKQKESAPAPEKPSLSHFHYGNSCPAAQFVTSLDSSGSVGPAGSKPGLSIKTHTCHMNKTIHTLTTITIIVELSQSGRRTGRWYERCGGRNKNTTSLEYSIMRGFVNRRGQQKPRVVSPVWAGLVVQTGSKTSEACGHFLSYFPGFRRPNLITGLIGWRAPD